MNLQEQIEKSSKEIHSDGYAMSIGELMSMYDADELDIHPEFQRFYRWSNSQKSRLIESILIGIPLPSIFVAQREDGVWDVIDGLQRLSTIFELAGVLKDEKGKKLAALKLEKTKYLPAMENKVWSSEFGNSHLDQAQRLYIKRAKIDVKIIKKESTQSSKYEMFQRLNTGGSPLTDQEVRNCMLIGIDRDAFERMQTLCGHDQYQECIALTDKAKDEQYDMELVLRFLALADASDEKVRSIGDIGEYLDEYMVNRAKDGNLADGNQEVFEGVFALLAATIKDDSFRRYDATDDRFKGGFLISAFEAISLGVAANLAAWTALGSERRDELLKQKVKELWQDEEFLAGIGSGKRASQRIPVTVPKGRECIKP
jgi:hypothetical protein